jgi:hypothetical protein
MIFEICRADLTTNSATKKWESRFTNLQCFGCKSIEFHLHFGNDYYFRIVIGGIFKENIERYYQELTKLIKVNYSTNFPRELTLEPLHIKEQEKLANIIDAINKLNLELPASKCVQFPTTKLLKEFNLILFY